MKLPSVGASKINRTQLKGAEAPDIWVCVLLDEFDEAGIVISSDAAVTRVAEAALGGKGVPVRVADGLRPWGLAAERRVQPRFEFDRSGDEILSSKLVAELRHEDHRESRPGGGQQGVSPAREDQLDGQGRGRWKLTRRTRQKAVEREESGAWRTSRSKTGEGGRTTRAQPFPET